MEGLPRFEFTGQIFTPRVSQLGDDLGAVNSQNSVERSFWTGVQKLEWERPTFWLRQDLRATQSIFNQCE